MTLGTFAYPDLFWAMLVLPVMVLWYILRYRSTYGTIRLSGLDGFRNVGMSVMEILRHGLFLLRLLAIALLIVALARPQSALSWKEITTEGIDIVLALDISGSMLARDLKPNRLEASKDVAMQFIEGRPNDRIGLVIYSGESFTQCPRTTDHKVLLNLFESVHNGMIEDGTAIGLGLATSVNRLKDSDGKSKVVILLTDGQNTTGSIPPLTAADIAQAFGTRVYTVGVGTRGVAPYPFRDAFGRERIQNIPVEIDEETLKEIAKTTGGAYFRATDNNSLEAIYQEIDKLEKSKISETEYQNKDELFFWWAFAAACLLGLEFLLRYTLFRSVTQ